MIPYLLLLVCIGASVNCIDDDEEQYRMMIVSRMAHAKTELLENYELVTRHIATDIRMFKSYGTSSLIFYSMPEDVQDAKFILTAEEIHLNFIGSCQPRDVIIHILYNGYPTVNPDGYDFPKDFIDESRREKIHTINIKSNGINETVSMSFPRPGTWYGLAYIKWEDPKTQKVEQQGLVPVCQTILYADLQVKKQDKIHPASCYSELVWDYNDLPATFKCLTATSGTSTSLNVSVVNAPANSDSISIKIQASSIPSEESNIISCSFDAASKTNEIYFLSHPNVVHYIVLDKISKNFTNIANCESYTRTDDEEQNHTIQSLMRDNKDKFFTFEYGVPTTDLLDTTSVVNITSKELSSLKFKINPFMDIGGSLVIEASLIMGLKYYMGYVRQTNNDTSQTFANDEHFFKVVMCLDIDHMSIPLESGLCRYNDKQLPALFVLNSTDSQTIYDKVIIPFPRSGDWYLTSGIFCDNLNGSNSCNTSMVLSLASSMCVGGNCSDHGNCIVSQMGNSLVSFCLCEDGYGGWDCSDDSRLDTKSLMLVSVLLLTLSNLPFAISVYIGIIRRYYIEAFVYACTLFFSTFYHACDSPQQVRYCMMRRDLIQYADFYFGITSFWVTLLAMAIIEIVPRTTLRFLGAIGIALLTKWNMYSVLTFVIPSTIGVLIVLVTWYLDYKAIGKFRYQKWYYRVHLPIGVTIVSIGLLCFAFFQTETNYFIVHSLWHTLVAVCIVFLLPDKRGPGTNPFLPDKNFCNFKFHHLFGSTRSTTPIAPIMSANLPNVIEQ